MDQSRFTLVTHSLTRIPSRRDVLRGLVAAGLGLGVAQPPDRAEARKKPKKKRAKKARPNAYGCLSVGVACQSAEPCCSGICEGKKCRAHGTGICRQDKPGICTASPNEAPALSCPVNCYCYRTTAGSNFCSGGVYTDGANCADCKKDADCLALGYAPGSACAPVSQGNCVVACDTGMACLYRCGEEPE